MKKIIFILFALSTVIATAQFPGLATIDFSATKVTGETYELQAKIEFENGAWVYGESDALIPPIPLVFNVQKSENYEVLSDWKFPDAKTKFVKEFEGDVAYYKAPVFIATRTIKSKAKDFTIRGDYQAQICNDTKCILSSYPNPKFTVNIGKGDELGFAKSEPTAVKSATLNVSPETNYDFTKSEKIVKDFNGQSIEEGKEESYWAFFLLAFISGLVALLTPCVFPMIPMTVSFFLKGSGSKTKGKLTAMFFGLSIIVIYVIIGSIINAIAGPDAANYIATHWLPNVLFFTVFIFFAASFFGMFEITLPSKWSNVSDQKADKGGFGGAFFMALTLSIVSFSCTGPIIGNVLVESVATGGTKPLIGMFGFSLAFALPFTFFAFFPSLLNKLPKSGGWLNSVKVVLGFVELALALKFLSVADQTAHWGILDREVYLALWIVIFFLLGLYLLGKLKFAHDSDLPFIKVPRLVFAIISFSFVVYLLPGMWGAPLKGLSGYLPPMSTMDFNLPQMIAGDEGVVCKDEPTYSNKLHLPHGLKGYFDYEEGMLCAQEQNKPVFIDFTGHGCVNCRKIEDGVWSDPAILELLQKEFVIISLYIDEHTIDLPQEEQYISKFDGETKIVTLGQKNADIQKVWFNKISQPYYVTFDNNENLLNVPIAYAEASDKMDFRKFLVNSLKEFKKRNK